MLSALSLDQRSFWAAPILARASALILRRGFRAGAEADMAGFALPGGRPRLLGEGIGERTSPAKALSIWRRRA